MPRKPEAKPVDLPAIPAELVEQFGSGPMTAEAINAATLAFKRALGGEMSHHRGYPPDAAKPSAVTNQRNGMGVVFPTFDAAVLPDVQHLTGYLQQHTSARQKTTNPALGRVRFTARQYITVGQQTGASLSGGREVSALTQIPAYCRIGYRRVLSGQPG